MRSLFASFSIWILLPRDGQNRVVKTAVSAMDRMAENNNVRLSAPFFSIVLPTYNRARLLPRAITSVLHQTFKDWELLVADDGSSDNTAPIIKEFLRSDTRVKYITHVHSGLAHTRNFGV